MSAWVAIWGPDPVRLHWQLTVTDEAGNVAMTERSHALYGSPHPGDDLLVTMSLCPAGDWERDRENGSWSCPVIVTSQSREDELAVGLLAAGRSCPGSR